MLLVFLFFGFTGRLSGVVYTHEFIVSIVLTGLVMTLPISANIALSLGMVGALSIIRFRTAIKTPKDIVRTFWAIAVGIISGAGLYIIALTGSPIIGLFMFLLNKKPVHKSEACLLVTHYSSEADADVQIKLPKHKMRSRTAIRKFVICRT